jgi:hypothetical protein
MARWRSKSQADSLTAGLMRCLLERSDDIETFVALTDELGAVAARLRESQAREMAVRGAIGPDARRITPLLCELLAEVLMARVSALRPHVPMVTEASAVRAVDALQVECGIEDDFVADDWAADEELDDGDEADLAAMDALEQPVVDPMPEPTEGLFS